MESAKFAAKKRIRCVALLSGCLALAAGCEQGSEFRITGTVEGFVATGEAVLVGATSVPGEERVLVKAPIDRSRFDLLGESDVAQQVKVKILVEEKLAPPPK